MDVWNAIRDLFFNAKKIWGSDHVSKHAAGRAAKFGVQYVVARRKRNKAAAAMRRIQRRRDRSSSKRQR